MKPLCKNYSFTAKKLGIWNWRQWWWCAQKRAKPDCGIRISQLAGVWLKKKKLKEPREGKKNQFPQSMKVSQRLLIHTEQYGGETLLMQVRLDGSKKEARGQQGGGGSTQAIQCSFLLLLLALKGEQNQKIHQSLHFLGTELRQIGKGGVTGLGITPWPCSSSILSWEQGQLFRQLLALALLGHCPTWHLWYHPLRW